MNFIVLIIAVLVVFLSCLIKVPNNGSSSNFFIIKSVKLKAVPCNVPVSGYVLFNVPNNS
jgi:hypothetical protein